MKPQITLLCVSLLSAGPALADGGSLRFEGQVVEAGCSITAVNPDQGQPNLAPVATHLALHISERNDACSRGYTAFTSQYELLQTSDTEADAKVITLTYN